MRECCHNVSTRRVLDELGVPGNAKTPLEQRLQLLKERHQQLQQLEKEWEAANQVDHAASIKSNG